MKLALIALLFNITPFTYSQNRPNNLSRGDFTLQGNVEEIVETFVVRGSKKKYRFRDTVYTTQYFFGVDGTFSVNANKLKRKGGVDCYQSLDSTEYLITQDTITGFERAEKITMDSIDHEIHYRKYNDQGYLIFDSIRYRKFFEPDTCEGPITNHYEYDQFGNLTFHKWKSSFVLALLGSTYYTYKFDDFGNWIERRAYPGYKINLKVKGKKKVPKRITPKSITYRRIHYL